MRYDGKINRKLSQIDIDKENWKIFPDVIEYKLAYGKTKHKYFENKEILNYINENYLKNDNIIEENLLNDLITFKTYRSQVEEYIANGKIFQDALNFYITVISVIISIYFGVLSIEKDLNATLFVEMMKDNIIIFILVLLLFIFPISIAIARTSDKSQSSKIKFINNAIYTLETIKEDMYRNGNSGTESDERYEGLELTEVKEIRTYKATRNKYRPRAMHHRKRR